MIDVEIVELAGGAVAPELGRVDGAVEPEPLSALAALSWLEVARLAAALDVRLGALDHAVARAPALDTARWARLEARLDVADLRGARADAEHLEAAARGPEARHAVWRRVAVAFLARGHVAEASALFERALRYAPDDPEAVLGLARSLRAAGQGRRALDLLARAIALAERAGQTAHDATIELARALAEIVGDRPAAIARVRAVPAGLAESAAARFFEGRWRADLGDLAGAAIAFGRLRDAVELAAPVDPDAISAMLAEAAEIEERERRDLHAAQLDLGLALRLRPHDRRIAASFRRVAAEVIAVATPPAPRPPAPPPPRPSPLPPPPASEPPPPASEPAPPASEPPPPASEPPPPASEPAPDSAADAQRVDRLTERLRGDPDDHATAMELSRLLARLGRDLDLLALLSARMEEGDDEVRSEVAPLRREVLLRLAAAARAEGRSSEAELYEMMASVED